MLFQGHKVVANTLVNGDVHQMMKTDAVFEQPDRFWPERYIAEDRVTLRKVSVSTRFHSQLSDFT